jgi:hypothetical protein
MTSLRRRPHRKLDDARIGKRAPVTLVPVAKLFGIDRAVS